MIRKFNITHLLENGKRIVPLDLIIDYRFIKLDEIVKVSIWCTTNNKGYKCLGVQQLFRPVDNRIPLSYTLDFNTDILAMKDQEATGLFVHIENAEYIELKRLSMTYNVASRLTGRATDSDVWYPPYPETDWYLTPFIPSRMYDDALRVTPFMPSTYDAFAVTPFNASIRVERTVTPFMISTYLGMNIGPFVPSHYVGYGVTPYQMSGYVELSVIPFEISCESKITRFYLGDFITPPVVMNSNRFFLGELI